MTNNTNLCFPPFLDAAAFTGGGYLAGRNCNAKGVVPGTDLVCCLPCPATDWLYSDDFRKADLASQWLNVVGIILLSLLLLSQIILPPQKRSNYLGICLTGSALGVAIGYALPLATKPDQCYDAVTPNDMYSSTTCALTGAMITTGGLSVLTWILVRAISMHLQVCWDTVPGPRFFWTSQILAWGVPVIFANTTLFASGVSFRFGDACYLNHNNSMIFWGPLITIGGAAVLCQLMTLGYCAKVYLSSTFGGCRRISASAIRSDSIASVYRRLSEVLRLQWRSMCLVTIVLLELSLFCVLFIYLDHSQQEIIHQPELIAPWVECLVRADGQKDKCLHLVHGWYVRESVSNASLILYSFVGIVVFVLLIQPSVFGSCWSLIFNARSKDQLSSLESTGSPGHPRPHTAFLSDFDYKSPITSPDPSFSAFRQYEPLRTKTSFLSDSDRAMTSSSTSPPPSYMPYFDRHTTEYGHARSLSSQTTKTSLYSAPPAVSLKDVFSVSKAVEAMGRMF